MPMKWWIPMDIHRETMDLHGSPQFVDVHEIPWKSMEVWFDALNVGYLFIEREATYVILRVKWVMWKEQNEVE